MANARLCTPALFGCFFGARPAQLGFREELVLRSHEHGLVKPSARLFALARERLAAAGVLPGAVLMVGNDAHRDLAPARRAGIQTALSPATRRSLREIEEAGAAAAVITSLAELPRLLA